MSGKEVLLLLMEILQTNLEELYSLETLRENQFVAGEKTAYVECLEIIQHWDQARANGLNWEIEKRFPV